MGLNITLYIYPHSTATLVYIFSRPVLGQDGERAINNCIRIPLVADSRHVKSAATHVAPRAGRRLPGDTLSQKSGRMCSCFTFSVPALSRSTRENERAAPSFSAPGRTLPFVLFTQLGTVCRVICRK
jgi:hypothetical protein